MSRTENVLDLLRLSESLEPTSAWGITVLEEEKSNEKQTYALNGHESVITDPTVLSAFDKMLHFPLFWHNFHIPYTCMLIQFTLFDLITLRYPIISPP